MSKLRLYISTALHLKPSQVAYRVWRRMGGRTRLRLGYRPAPDPAHADVSRVPVLPELDFDPAFLSRFDADAILADRIELLHHEEAVDWHGSWYEPFSTPLWRFNLHYHEYLLPLAKAFLDTGDARYLEKAKAVIASWIESCPRSRGGVPWDPYVISMRVVNWLAFYGELRGELDRDASFVSSFNRSLAEQFLHLAQHLEKDLLANHYLENLKALTILSCYFDDVRTLDIVLPKLHEQVGEQILPDGMHFELSPMYHKIVLEDLLRVAACLVAHGEDAGEVAESLRLQDMCDALWSLERNTNRTPLFNDSGDNVAKCRDALLECSCKHFGIEPMYRCCLPDAGYAMLERETDSGLIKIIFDAGRPGPIYAMGHVHCDCLSLECFIDGEPWVVNCGTYAYQDRYRLDFKSTLSHSTILVEGIEQHECWAPFRIARYSSAVIEGMSGPTARGVLKQRGERAEIHREIMIEEDAVRIIDGSECAMSMRRALHFAFGAPCINGCRTIVAYAPEFGEIRGATQITSEIDDASEIVLYFPEEKERAI